MPQLNSIAIADGKAAPVTHTFSGTTTNGSAAKLHNRAASIPRGFEVLDALVYNPKSDSGSHRVIFTLTLPVVATVNGLDTVVRTSKCEIAFSLSQDSTEAERKDIRVLAMNLLANANVVTMVEKIEPLY